MSRPAKCSLPHRQLRNHWKQLTGYPFSVHCRTGSSEIAWTAPPWITPVHCSTGSSETQDRRHPRQLEVHCRTGSSEKLQPTPTIGLVVHGRTGSSEKQREQRFNVRIVHCRTGSSEIQFRHDQQKPTVHCRTGNSEKTKTVVFDPILVQGNPLVLPFRGWAHLAKLAFRPLASANAAVETPGCLQATMTLRLNSSL